MFFSCPHCRELVATDRDSRLPPPMCPRCGGALREAEAEAAAPAVGAERGPSIASFLRGELPTNATLAQDHDAMAAAVAHEPAEGAATRPGSTDGFPGDDGPALPLASESPAAVKPSAPPAALPASRIASLPLEEAPSFMRARALPAAPHAARWQWAAVLVLAAALSIQVLIADRARLAADAHWRPVIVSLCSVLGCSVPPWHQPGAISMLSRDVSPIAGSVSGLDVRATFRNDARWPQPWPVLLLSLSDADGRVLGSRAFLPVDYLGAEATQTELAPGQSARIALKLREPDPQVVAFSFDFR